MKIFFLKTLLLTVLIIGVLSWLGQFKKPSHQYMNTVSAFNKIIEESKDVDIAIFGSSHAYCSYNPKVIDSITKTRSFNFGNDSQRVIVSKYILKETLKDISPKLVILDVYPPSIRNPIGEKALAYQMKSYYYNKFSFEKVKSVIEVFPFENAKNIIFPSLKRNDFKFDFDFKKNSHYTHSQKAKASEYRGFTGYDLVMKEKVNLKPNQIKGLALKVKSTKDSYERFSEEEALNLISFIQFAKNNNTEVLFVIAPYYAVFNPKGKHAEFHNYMSKLSKDNNVKLLDFNLHWDELKYNIEDFKDKSHLSHKGANKTSRYLANYINKTYQIPSREKDPLWISEQPLGLKEFLSKEYANNKQIINTNLSADFKFESFKIMKHENKKKLIIKLDNKVNDSILNKYKLGFHTFVNDVDKDKLSGYSKSKGRNYDAWDFAPEIQEIDGQKYIIKTLATPITEFKTIKFFLYDRAGYKGLIGEALEIKNVKIN